jgi:two-component system sensor histidine kinase KdpD
MRSIRLQLTTEMYVKAGKAVLTVAATTVVLLLIGRPTLGEAVIALLYLVPVGWSASRWGQGAGMAAALAAALTFDFFFIPPFLTFTVGSLEGWLVLVIFLAVGIVVVGRIESALSRARTSEREAIFMYELSAALAGLRTQSAVAHVVARRMQQLYVASLARVVLESEGQAPKIEAEEPRGGAAKGRPDRVLPILNAWGLVGEVQLWRGLMELPPEQSRLLQNLASQAGQALERTRLTEAENHIRGEKPTVEVN